jgi:hypothetical protein
MKYIVIIFLVVSVNTSIAQNPSISGFVIDEHRKPIPGANVIILSNAITENIMPTDADGKFVINFKSGAKFGEAIRLRITQNGYIPLEKEAVVSVSKQDFYTLKLRLPQKSSHQVGRKKGVKTSPTKIYNAKPEIVFFESDRKTFRAGDSILLHWQVRNSSRVFLIGYGEVTTINRLKVEAIDTTIFRLIALNPSWDTSAIIKVDYEPEVIKSLMGQWETFSTGKSSEIGVHVQVFDIQGNEVAKLSCCSDGLEDHWPANGTEIKQLNVLTNVYLDLLTHGSCTTYSTYKRRYPASWSFRFSLFCTTSYGRKIKLCESEGEYRTSCGW